MTVSVNTPLLPFGPIAGGGGGGSVNSVTAANSSIVIGGTATDPTVKVGNTAVTPGSYTAADITVDATGRVTAASDSGLTALTPIAVQSSAVAPVNGQWVPCDATSAGFTVTLPATPADGTLIGAGLAATASGHTVTVSGNGATFGDGSLSAPVLKDLGEAVICCYNAALNTWWVLSGYLPVTGFTMQGYLAPAVTTLTFASSITLNAALGNVFQVTLTASTGTLATPSGARDGQPVRVRIIQDGTGSRTLAYSGGWDFGAAGAPTLSTAAGAVDYLAGEWNAALAKVCVSAALGF